MVWRWRSDGFVGSEPDEDVDGDAVDVVVDIRFPGQYFDAETGLHYNRFRYYDPSIGRYISPDPIGQAGGVHVYSYVANSPVNWIDPFGLDIWTEGPSHNEPTGHVSINFGDPLGEYTSYSFGIAIYCPGGCVYPDTEQGGEIQSYFEASPEDTLSAEVALLRSAEADNDAWYGVEETCRSYSNEKYKEFAEKYQNSSSDPPDRPAAPRNPLRSLQDALMGWMF